jgi:hypothetical protein
MKVTGFNRESERLGTNPRKCSRPNRNESAESIPRGSAKVKYLEVQLRALDIKTNIAETIISTTVSFTNSCAVL